MFSTIKSVGLMVVLALTLVGCDGSPPMINLAPAQAKAAQCVEPTADMRKNHMSYLMQHRDATVLAGIRTQQYSLNACISCHVDPTRADGSPVHYESKDHFCASCHTYAGVKLDCFQCHADRPEVAKQTDYQHKVGSAESYHFSAQVVKSASPSAQELKLVAGSLEEKP